MSHCPVSIARLGYGFRRECYVKTIAAIILALLSQVSIAAMSNDKQLLQLAEQYNKHLPKKFGNLIIEKVRYVPGAHTLATTHRLLDKDASQITQDMLALYQRMSKKNFVRQLCLAKPAPKSRAYLLKQENLLLKYQYVDRNKKPLFTFSVSKQDCARQ